MSQEQLQYLALAFLNLERLSILGNSVTTVTVFPSPDAHLDPGTPLQRHTSDSVTYTVTLKYTGNAENVECYRFSSTFTR